MHLVLAKVVEGTETARETNISKTRRIDLFTFYELLSPWETSLPK